MRKVVLCGLAVFLLSASVYAQEKIPGVGYRPTNMIAKWLQVGTTNDIVSVPINISGCPDPFGPNWLYRPDLGLNDRNNPSMDGAFVCTFMGGDPNVRKGRKFIGEDNERFEENFHALKAAFEAGALGSPEKYTGVPTIMECYFLAATGDARIYAYRRNPQNPTIACADCERRVRELLAQREDCGKELEKALAALQEAKQDAEQAWVEAQTLRLLVASLQEEVALLQKKPVLSPDAKTTLEWLATLDGTVRIGAGRKAAIGRLQRELKMKLE